MTNNQAHITHTDIDQHQVNPYHVELHIEELVLDGFPALDGARLGAIVQQELGRLFIQQGIPNGLEQRNMVARLDGGEFQAESDSDAQAIGAQIAQAVYGGLSR